MFQSVEDMLNNSPYEDWNKKFRIQRNENNKLPLKGLTPDEHFPMNLNLHAAIEMTTNYAVSYSKCTYPIFRIFQSDTISSKSKIIQRLNSCNIM